ncbi:hypothetical protein DB347_09755 [Opitutaceae bacterium EW11]|nr:hypothetical protein DB347_09755 [Opitutaceae bacterium EW11]
MDAIEARLHALGLSLPAAPIPGGNYLPYRFNGESLVLAGTISIRDGVLTHAGQVGDGQTVESGYEAARVCALNTLAAIKAALGSLERVTDVIYVAGYVNAVAGFGASPQVIDGASDLFAQLYGECGKHARTAIAVAGLPKNATVEIQVTVRFR